MRPTKHDNKGYRYARGGSVRGDDDEKDTKSSARKDRIEVVQNDNVPVSSKYGTDVWSDIDAKVVKPGSASGAVIHNSTLRPSMLTEAEKIRLKRKTSN